jgi:hypothetical protein
MQVRIYKPTKNTMQSGDAKDFWVLETIPQNEQIFIEELMGRTSSMDMMREVSIKFNNQEEAINFAEMKGYEYEIIVPKKRKLIKKTYASNFK